MARNTRSLRKVLHVQCAVLEILSSEDLNPKNFNKNFLMIDVMIAHKCNHNTVIATGDITNLVFFLSKLKA